MHIALLSPAWPPAAAANGIVTYVSVMRDHLLQRGHDVSVLADSVLHRSDNSAVPLPPLNPPSRFWPKMIDRLNRRLGHHPFTGRSLGDQLRRAAQIAPIDLVEMEESFGWSGTVARMLKVPVVTRLHGPWFLKPQTDRSMKPSHARHRKLAEGWAIKSAGNLSAPNGIILSATCDKYRIPASRGVVIPNPVAVAPDNERWRIDDCEQDLILFVGRLDLLKGADTMIAAFARIMAERPSARLKMVGPTGRMEQPDGTVIGFYEYARLTLEQDVLERIDFTGLLSPTAIRELRRRAHVTVVASTCENLPYAAVEAMAVGNPLISTDWLGAAGVIADGKTGWLTPVGDDARLAERVNWVLANPQAASDVGHAGWKHCGAVYGIDEVGDQTIAFYKDVIARHAA